VRVVVVSYSGSSLPVAGFTSYIVLPMIDVKWCSFSKTSF